MDESFMETWLREPDGGAVAAVGASANSWWTEDDYLEKMLFRAIYDENYTSYGAAWLAPRSFISSISESRWHRTRDYFEMYNIMGDPTIELRRTELEITSPAQLPPARELQPYEYLLAAANGTGPFGWSLIAGTLPEGLQLDGAGGRIFGTPTAYGTFAFTLQVQDSSAPPQLQTKAFSLK